MLAARAVTRFTRRVFEIVVGDGLVTGRLAEAGRMALHALGIGLVLGGKQVERSGVLGLFPFHKLIEMAGGTFLDADVLLIGGWRRLGFFRLSPDRCRATEH